jgi:hypothetical protein
LKNGYQIYQYLAVTLNAAFKHLSIMMHRKGTTLIIMLCWLCAMSDILAQTDYSAVDKRARNTPESEARDMASLANYLCADAQTDTEKARAIYIWISSHIAYRDSSDGGLWTSPEEARRQRPESVLRNRSAVCRGYANLFFELAKAAGLPCHIVTGTVREEGVVSDQGHAWVAVFTDGQWHLCDPTWGTPRQAGTFHLVDKYFFCPPGVLILEHLPDDPVWQLLENPILDTDFRTLSDMQLREMAIRSVQGRENYLDTLQTWLALDSVQRLFSAERRILRFSADNERSLFKLGQDYLTEFYNLTQATADLVRNQILHPSDTIPDSFRFFQDIDRMKLLYQRAYATFARLKDPARLHRVSRLYSEKDLIALVKKLEGDHWTALFEHEFHQKKKDEKNFPLDRLRHFAKQMDSAYLLARKEMDCPKMNNHCDDMRHNISLVHLKLATRMLYAAQVFLWEKGQAAPARSLIRDTQEHLEQSAGTTSEMLNQKPVFQYVMDRMDVIWQTRINLRVAQAQIRREELLQRLDKVFESTNPSGAESEKLAGAYRVFIQQNSQLLDSLQAAKFPFDAAKQSEIAQLFALDIVSDRTNLANLYYRQAAAQYTLAQQARRMPDEAANIKANAQKGLRQLEKTNEMLTAIKNKDNTKKGTQQAARIKEAIMDLLRRL